MIPWDLAMFITAREKNESHKLLSRQLLGLVRNGEPSRNYFANLDWNCPASSTKLVTINTPLLQLFVNQTFTTHCHIANVSRVWLFVIPSMRGVTHGVHPCEVKSYVVLTSLFIVTQVGADKLDFTCPPRLKKKNCQFEFYCIAKNCSPDILGVVLVGILTRCMVVWET